MILILLHSIVQQLKLNFWKSIRKSIYLIRFVMLKKIIYLILIISNSATCQELANYGTPIHSSINNTVGTVVQDQVSPAYIISFKEATERINIETDTEKYTLGDQAYLLFDYDNDGNMDLVGWLQNETPCNDCDGYVTGYGKWIWWEDYFNESTQPIYYDSGIWFSARLEAGDFNGDGVLDVVFENENHHDNGEGGYYTEEHYPLVLLEFSSNGMTERLIGPPTGSHSLATGDIDNDGDIDIVEAEWQYGDCDHISTPKFYINDGNGNFSVSKTNLIESETFLQNNSCADMTFTYVDLFDMNNDGFLDLIAGFSDNQQIPEFLENMYSSIGYNPELIYIMYGDGTSNFSLQNAMTIDYTTPNIENCEDCALTLLGGNFLDYNNDGFFDLITIGTYNYSGVGINVFKNIDGNSLVDVTDEIIIDPVQLHSEISGPFTTLKIGDLGISYELRVLDIDDDGDFDIMPQYTTTGDWSSTTRMAYWENNNGSFTLVKFDDPISNINISNVVNTWFSSPAPVENTYGDISNWDVSGVTNMNQLFHTRTDFNYDLSSWDISNVTNMFMIFHSSGLSTANYDNILNGWSQQDVQPNVELGAGQSIYFCSSSDARMSLIENYNWNIIDGGLNCSNLNLNEQNQLDISIYPNPTSDIVYINGNYTQLKVGVFDILGKQLMNKSIKNNIDISQLEKGVYLLQFSDGSKLTTQRIIKK
jgi:hypothetical protein